ncbi:c-type cytochrome [Kitasatospora viridis]|uniref:Cytochrome bc1 complex cytochrome c subunit n=1 Tax=Kitasatospora viridis TaxID=281105 RepID=A0A561UM17_9ACTN|nr:c-type cytochrome [Kitasatospora viridis]TWG00405.1 menaquinol-cytochrome c reductase cytochrome c1 subunit precursor [Kitasatospora viridis]
MKKLSARRRHPLAALVVLLFALVASGGLYAAFAPTEQAQADSSAQSLAIDEGKRLFAVGCSSCHGLNGQGSSMGPSLVGVGSAAVDFQVGTGRMPAQQPGAQVPRKKTIYNQSEIDQLAAFVASLGPGPATPTKDQYTSTETDAISKGGDLFRTNCSQCHNFAGAGGALTQGKFAPSLENVDPKYIYEAMQTGPQNMPSFPDSTMPEQQKQQIVAFVRYQANEAPNPGGLSLGSLGPVTEGLFGWIFGLGVLIAVAIWVAAHTTKAKKS